MKNKIFIILILSLLSINLYAQNGTIRGTIIDNETGETLIGVSIALVGTTTGTITDFDGNYSLDLPQGTYDIVYSYISYEKKTITGVTIKPGEVTVVDVNLGQAELAIEEVVVTAKANKQTETAVMVMQKKAGIVMDGISSQQISRLGDSHAAAALKRVTGVSVQGGKYVFVRGLSDRYTKTTLNNAEIPALDPEKNTVQMDIFPSNIIENIMVRKTFSPEMPGESSGGLVDIATKDFPEKFTLHFSTSWKYNTQASMNDQFITYDGGKYDIFGMDGGERTIPDYPQSVIDNMEARGTEQIIYGEYSVTELRDFSTPFNTNVYPVEDKSFFDQSYKLAVGNQIKLFNKALGFNVALSYSNDFDYYDNGEANRYSDAIRTEIKELNDRRGAKNVKLTGLANLNYKLSNNHKTGFRFLRNQSGSQGARYRYGRFNYEETNIQERNLSYLDRNFTSMQLHGKHVIPALNNATITWLSSGTFMTQNEPDTRFFTNLYEGDEYTFKTNVVPVRLYRDMEELDMDNKIDIEIPFTLFDEKAKVKFGGEYLYKDRDAWQNKLELFNAISNQYIGSQELDGNLGTYIENSIISETNQTGLFYTMDNENNKIMSYVGELKVTAGYAQIDFKAGKNLRVLTGARFENTYLSVSNYSTVNNVEKSIDRFDVLPALNLTYTVIDNMNVRLAGSRTISRPSFREIAPASFYDYILGTTFTGNSNLEASLVTNLDFRWEYYFDRGEMVALSAFYKNFEKPIETYLDVGSQNEEVLYRNAERTDLYGLEAEVRLSLDVIEVLRHFSVGGNLTLVQSEVELTEDEMKYRDETKRPMIGQAPYVINTYLGYDNPDIKLNANIGFNTNGKKLFLVTKQATPYVYETPRPSLNFNIAKGIGENFNVCFSIDNILNKDFELYYDYADKKYFYLKYSEGITFGVSVKYLID